MKHSKSDIDNESMATKKILAKNYNNLRKMPSVLMNSIFSESMYASSTMPSNCFNAKNWLNATAFGKIEWHRKITSIGHLNCCKRACTQQKDQHLKVRSFLGPFCLIWFNFPPIVYKLLLQFQMNTYGFCILNHILFWRT